MSEKVFGISRGNAKTMLRLFREEQAKNGREGCYCNECEDDMRNALKIYEDIVSVRLAYESVDLEKLKKFCERNRMNLLIHRDEKRQEGILLKDLLSWAEKEAKKQAGEKK